MGIIIILNNASATTGPKLAQGVCLLTSASYSRYKKESVFLGKVLEYTLKFLSGSTYVLSIIALEGK